MNMVVERWNWVLWVIKCFLAGNSVSCLKILGGCGVGLQIQAMDTANVCMVQLELSHEGFDPYRCDKNIMLGIKLSE